MKLSSGNAKTAKVAIIAVASLAAAAAIRIYKKYRRSDKAASDPSALGSNAGGVTSVQQAPLKQQLHAGPLKAQEELAKTIAAEPKAKAPQGSISGASGKILGEFEFLYHMTHIHNLESILKSGMLAKSILTRDRLSIVDISDPSVQDKRDRIEPVHNRSIHEYVPFYLSPRNPMLFKRREIQDDIIILGVSTQVLVTLSHLFTDGNAASGSTTFSQNETVLAGSLDVLRAKYWLDYEDGKRRKCAEVLVHSHVDPTYIETIACSNGNTLAQIKALTKIRTVVDKSHYF